MSFGVFLSTICNTSMEAIKLCIGATLPHMLATGIFWPLEVTSYVPINDNILSCDNVRVI